MVELVVFLIAGAFALVGAVGVVTAKNPVHSALMLVMTLFAVAVLFLAQDAQFLAAVQVIVYAGAIVVVFLFVIMLLGVDQTEDLKIEPLMGQRSVGLVVGVAIAVLAIVSVWGGATGDHAVTAPKLDAVTLSAVETAEVTLGDNQTDGTEQEPNINQLGKVIFTDYVFAFEITALLLTISVVGAVVLARQPKGELAPIPESALAKLGTQAAASSGESAASDTEGEAADVDDGPVASAD